MNRDGNNLILSTGRTVYAHAGILGVAEGNPHTLYYGYDGIVEQIVPEDPEPDPRRFTLEERREIHDYMVMLWGQWATVP